jgi:hypothetical protein
VEINWFLLELSAPGLSPEDWRKRNSERERGVDVTSFLAFSFCGERIQSDFCFGADDFDFGEAAGQPSEVYGSCCISGG